MTIEQFSTIRAACKMTLQAVADYLRVELRTVQRYEAGDRAIPGPVEKLMEMLEQSAKRRKPT